MISLVYPLWFHFALSLPRTTIQKTDNKACLHLGGLGCTKITLLYSDSWGFFTDLPDCFTVQSWLYTQTHDYLLWREMRSTYLIYATKIFFNLFYRRPYAFRIYQFLTYSFVNDKSPSGYYSVTQNFNSWGDTGS